MKHLCYNRDGIFSWSIGLDIPNNKEKEYEGLIELYKVYLLTGCDEPSAYRWSGLEKFTRERWSRFGNRNAIMILDEEHEKILTGECGEIGYLKFSCYQMWGKKRNNPSPEYNEKRRVLYHLRQVWRKMNAVDIVRFLEKCGLVLSLSCDENGELVECDKNGEFSKEVDGYIECFIDNDMLWGEPEWSNMKVSFVDIDDYDIEFNDIVVEIEGKYFGYIGVA